MITWHPWTTPVSFISLSILVSDLAAGGTHYQSTPAVLALLFQRPTQSCQNSTAQPGTRAVEVTLHPGLLLLTKISAGIHPNRCPGVWGNSLPETGPVLSSHPLPVHENRRGHRMHFVRCDISRSLQPPHLCTTGTRSCLLG